MKRLALFSALTLAAFFGGAVNMCGGAALASRNSSGTMSLYTPGNPVTTGSTISSSWANNTLNDIASEVTNSLDRNGRGAMLAQLQSYSGSVSAPGLSFASDSSSGLYRAGSHDLRMSVNGADTAKWTTSGSFTLNGLTATNSGSGAAITATGGSSDNLGGSFTGGSTNGIGVSGTGAGGGAGGTFANGTAATGATARDAVALTNGYLSFSGVTNPNSTVGFTNRLTPKNMVKAWGLLTTNGSGACSVADGFNLTSCSVAAGGTVTVTFASSFANTNYSVFGTASRSGPKVFYVNSAGTSSMTFNVYNSDFTTQTDCATLACTVSYQVVGAQ